ncbi:MAG TPA: DUF433 domain-containing protein [Thermoanaerobaculia bacterium]|jgi:uncharacterized protein (DUF433 family)|nr:DUF433 domain-containing protein [Thermoanaerobaculia bacterium]
MATLTNIGTLIVRDPEIRGGRPRLAGSGVTVRSIVIWYQQGLTPEQIVDQFGHLSLAQVYAALAYYHANRDEIDADLAEEDRLFDALTAEQLDKAS